MSDIPDLFQRATEAFGKRVAAIADDQWKEPTPCTEWDVRALVNHLVGEQIWIPPLLTEGLTVQQVGDRFDGELLGDDPKAAWEVAAKEAIASFSTPGAMTKTVHLSTRDTTGERYAQEVLCDLIIHGWDLAKGIGADDTIEPELLDACWDIGVPMVREWRQAGQAEGAFAPEPEIDAGADRQTQLLAQYGRRRAWKP